MPGSIERGLSVERYETVEGDVARLAVELSDEQLLQLTDRLHELLRSRCLKRRPRAVGLDCGEARSFVPRL